MSKQLRLFCLRDTSGKLLHKDGKLVTFGDKMSAKKARNASEGLYVTFGPDHNSFKGK